MSTKSKVHIDKEYTPPEWKKPKKRGPKKPGSISNAKRKTNASYWARRLKKEFSFGCGCITSLENDVLVDCGKEYCENV